MNKTSSNDAAEELEKKTTVEPPESDHPKCADLVFANGRWSITRIEPQEVSLRKKVDTSTLKGLCYPTRMCEPMKTNLKKSAFFQVVSEILDGCIYLSKSQPSFDR